MLLFLNKVAFLSLKIVFVFANSADPNAAFLLGIHCLPKYLLYIRKFLREFYFRE